MKNVFLNLLITACFLAGASATAQFKKPGLTVGANLFYANPQGDFKNDYKGGLGAEVRGGVGLGNTYVVASAGYAAFAARSGNEYGLLTYKPVKVGLKKYLLAKRIFLVTDLGVANLKDRTTNTSVTRFAKGAGAGARLFGMEAGIYYDSWGKLHGNGSANSVQFKLGYNLTL